MTSNYPFVAKLFTMLSESENNAFISWGPDGGAFFVWNPTEFSSTVLPKYFKHNNFCSFVRQLNIYGFHKVENEHWMFTHDDKLFQRDHPELISKIQRRRQQKRTGGSNTDEGDDYIVQQSAPKKMKSEEFVAPSMNHHFSSATTPMTPMTPAILQSPVSVSISSVTTSSLSSMEEDVAYLKNMNGVLLSELTQMKRKTQSQEDTISWLIQELARTQRHVELMSQQQQSLTNSGKIKLEFPESAQSSNAQHGTQNYSPVSSSVTTSYASPQSNHATPVPGAYSYDHHTLSVSNTIPSDFNTDYGVQVDDFALYEESALGM